MFAEKSKDLLKGSITKTATVSIVTQLVTKYLLKMNINTFNETWLKNTLATMAGFAIHDLLTYKLNGLYKFKDNKKQKALKDVLYFGTMLLSKELILSFINNEEFHTDKLFPIGLALAGYIIYNMFIGNKITSQLGNNKTKLVVAIEDMAKTSLALLVSDFIPDQDIELKNLPILFSLLVSVPIYHLVTRPMIIDK
jgi:hypothetical protein